MLRLQRNVQQYVVVLRAKRWDSLGNVLEACFFEMNPDKASDLFGEGGSVDVVWTLFFFPVTSSRLARYNFLTESCGEKLKDR